jgi:quinol monooxygenase YgiN
MWCLFLAVVFLVSLVLVVPIRITTVTMSDTAASTPFSQPPSRPPPVFTLLVTLKFSQLEYRDMFLVDFGRLAQYVRDHEPDTLAYEVLVSDKSLLEVAILERYRNKEQAYLIVHKSSLPFLAFRPKLQALQDSGHVEVSGQSFLDARVGFGDRVE